eukprot:c7803_g1_i4.p1 GENE.c7803_g1_i4~~c7803_g1_i4.p1  ORF type:complete len:119 (-),score=17.56 c7803_g1_i4:38-394(-)
MCKDACRAMEALNGKVLLGRPLVLNLAREREWYDKKRTNGKYSDGAPNNHSNTESSTSPAPQSNASTELQIFAIQQKLRSLQEESNPSLVSSQPSRPQSQPLFAASSASRSDDSKQKK